MVVALLGLSLIHILDIVQIVRVKTVEFLPQLTIPHKEDYTAWCFRVAKHAAIDVIRRRPVPEIRLVETIARENDRVILNVDDRAMLNDVRRGILALDSHLQRDVLMLFSFGDYTNAEIAIVQESSEGAVKSLKPVSYTHLVAQFLQGFREQLFRTLQD